MGPLAAHEPREARADDVLREAAQRSRGRLAEHPIEPGGPFQPLTDLEDPAVVRALLRRLGATSMLGRLGQSRALDDPVLVGSTLLKDLLFLLTEITIQAWCRERRVLDVSVSNVLVDLSTDRPRVALREPVVAVIEGDDVAGSYAVADEHALLTRVGEWLLDDTARRLIAGLRGVVRVGERHLWGNIAVAVADTLISLSNEPSLGADDDRDAFFAAYPDLASHVEMVSVPDGRGGAVTCSIRRNCCLRVKLPDVPICLNCNLLSRDECIRMCSSYYVAQRSGTANDPVAAVLQIANT